MTTTTSFELLKIVNSPSELRHLSEVELVQVCDELRAHLLATVSQCGGLRNELFLGRPFEWYFLSL